MDNDIGNRPRVPTFQKTTPTPEKLFKNGFITKYQYDAQISNDPKAITEANNRAWREGIAKSEAMSRSAEGSQDIATPISNRARDASLGQNLSTRSVANSTNSSGQSGNPRAALTMQQKNFDTYVKFVEKKGKQVIDQNQMRDSGQEILDFLGEIKKNKNLSQPALETFINRIKTSSMTPNDEEDSPPSLSGLYSNEIFEEIDALFESMKTSALPFKITETWINEAGEVKSRSLGGGTEEVIFLRTLKNDYHTVIPKNLINNHSA